MYKYLTALVGLLLLPASSINAESSQQQFVQAALGRVNLPVTYDGSYYSIAYPRGDVPENIGVCTDVVIRTYREIGIDLQELLHKDIQANFDRYPSKRIWGLGRPDTNIDHRRVPNLQTFFRRQGSELPVSDMSKDYRPGDMVTWLLPGNLPHIGIVSNVYDKNSGNPMIVHNIGQGPKLDDVLFNYPITGHYRYLPAVQ